MEIGRVLATRGHIIEFATLEGQEGWIKGYDFISKLHTLGPGATHEQMNAHYLRMRTWDMSKGIASSMESKYLWDSFWPQTYHGLRSIMNDAATRPSFVVADFFVDAVKDIREEYNVPMAVVWPTMPFLMMPCSYIPGEPGFQLEGTLTSEKASMWFRLRNELVIPSALPLILKWMKWTNKMRLEHGVTRPVPKMEKPNYLLFVNSFFGLEIPRDLPPMCSAVGPLLSDEYPPLNDEFANFLSKHAKVVYIALGTHIILSNADASKIIQGLGLLLTDGLIDGVIWSMAKAARQDLEPETAFTLGSPPRRVNMGDILGGRESSFLCSHFVPQRAILDHPSTKVYFTHAGGSSANEGLFHGKLMLSMGVFADQLSNTAKIVDAGVAESINKFRFTPADVHGKMKKLLLDESGSYARNSLRLMRIAHVASRRKHHAADLVEEHMYDAELRFQDGKELRPMHLQTADMRMSKWKAKNWDLWTVSLATVGSLGFGLVYGARMLLLHRHGLAELVKGQLEVLAQRWGS